MGQITKDFAELMVKTAEAGNHTPLTVWEQKQFAQAWLFLHGRPGVVADEVLEAMRTVDWAQFGAQSSKEHYAELARAALDAFGREVETIAMNHDLAMGDRLQRIVARIINRRNS